MLSKYLYMFVELLNWFSTNSTSDSKNISQGAFPVQFVPNVVQRSLCLESRLQV